MSTQLSFQGEILQLSESELSRQRTIKQIEEQIQSIPTGPWDTKTRERYESLMSQLQDVADVKRPAKGLGGVHGTMLLLGDGDHWDT